MTKGQMAMFLYFTKEITHQTGRRLFNSEIKYREERLKNKA